MSRYHKSPYENLRNHIRYHNVRKWLLEGAKREDANTIREAIESLDDGHLERRLARMLAKSCAN
jgi:hypothetical protein